MDLGSMTEGFFQSYGRPGKIFILNHLRSEKGQAMNGRRVVVVGLDPSSTPISNRRINVRLLDINASNKAIGKILQIKPKNLVDPGNYCSGSPKPTLSQDSAYKFLQKAYENGLKEGHDKILGSEQDEARDRPMRMKLIKQYFANEVESSKTECMDPLIPPEKQNSFEMMKSAFTPACVGDGYVDFRRFGEGIIAGGQDMECAICQEHIQDDLIRLPCNHRFHLDCVKQWVQKESTCPTCRYEMEHSLETYAFPDSHNQIQNRFDEWFISGMCERCQAVNLENDPVVTVTRSDGMEVTMPLSSAKSQGYTQFKSVQGKGMERVNMEANFAFK